MTKTGENNGVLSQVQLKLHESVIYNTRNNFYFFAWP